MGGVAELIRANAAEPSRLLRCSSHRSYKQNLRFWRAAVAHSGLRIGLYQDGTSMARPVCQLSEPDIDVDPTGGRTCTHGLVSPTDEFCISRRWMVAQIARPRTVTYVQALSI